MVDGINYLLKILAWGVVVVLAIWVLGYVTN